jgi:hypothetical protein
MQVASVRTPAGQRENTAGRRPTAVCSPHCWWRSTRRSPWRPCGHWPEAGSRSATTASCSCARDVGTAHHPLLGSWTSASRLLGVDVNNPGPLYSDLLAPVIRLLGPWVGLAVGVMLVNMAASSLAVVAARRLAGAESMVAVALAVVGLQWALGSELLFDAWQPNALVLPFFAFLVAVTVLATGDVAMAQWVAAVGSLVVQTHVSHAVLVAALAVAGTALCTRAVRRDDHPGGGRGPLLATVAVMALACCQPVIEQVAGPGRATSPGWRARQRRGQARRRSARPTPAAWSSRSR